MQMLSSFVDKYGYFDLISLLAVICMAIFVLMVLLSYLRDRWLWNNGVCRKNGIMWTSCVMLDGRVKLSAGSIEKRIGRWTGSEEYYV